MSLPIDVVFAKGTTMVDLPNGARARVVLGTHWPVDDPLVRRRPDLFTRDSRFGMLYTEAKDEYDPANVPPMDDDVLADDDRDSADDAEQATAAPGERRNVRRPRS